MAISKQHPEAPVKATMTTLSSFRSPDEGPENDEVEQVIVIQRSTVYYVLCAVILAIGGYAAGWVMATAGASATSTAGVVREAVATAVAGLPRSQSNGAAQPRGIDLASLSQQVNPPEGYILPVKFGNIGPELLGKGAIDLARFTQVYEQLGRPLTEEQRQLLTKGSDVPVAITSGNAHFLLNFFWALGLVNQNRILTEGPMMQGGREQIGNYASTGGWTIGAKPPTELYSSTVLISLTADQQTRLEKVASGVYRPCCNNPTHFPDCNHGMAMLGLLELMASQNATEDAMFTTAKYVNAFWFPQQTLEVATYFKASQGLDFAQVDPRQVVGAQFSSGSGYQAVHQWLQKQGLLQQAGSGGGSCGVQ